MRARSESNEELRAIGVRPFVRHAQQSFRIQGAGEILVHKSTAIDRLAASATAFREIYTSKATQAHI
jgi:hypothetical protein